MTRTRTTITALTLVLVGACSTTPPTGAPSTTTVLASTTTVSVRQIIGTSECKGVTDPENTPGHITAVVLTGKGDALQIRWDARVAIDNSQGWYVSISHYQIGIKTTGRDQARFVFDLDTARQTNLPPSAATTDRNGKWILTVPSSAVPDIDLTRGWSATVTWRGTDVAKCEAAVG